MAAFPFDYTLPPNLIAQQPAEPRDHARLFVARRRDRSITHHRFVELPNLLAPGDLLVLNDTRVVPARLLGKRAATGGRWEGLFLRQFPDATWEMLCQTRGRLQPGERILVEPGSLVLQLLATLPGGRWHVRPLAEGGTIELLEKYGQIPLPPYIRKGMANDKDRERYQTVYAREPGAVAAPTAGLHFTPRVFEQLHERGIPWAFVTLHVGLDTFRPVSAERLEEHTIHGERYAVASGAWERIRAAERVLAVGTTTVRVLETLARGGPLEGRTELFITPGFEFARVDALVTNFHLPRSTLLALVMAFAGVEETRRLYRLAVEERYRFYSFGDAMLLL